MDRKKLLKNLVVIMVLMFLANSVALRLYWYSSIWWFDMLMHFFGGFWEGLLFLWFFPLLNLPFLHLSVEKIDFRLVIKTIVFVLVIGVLWELFEMYTHNYIANDSFNALDTTSDIFFDLAGGFAAILYVGKRIMLQSSDNGENS